VTRPTIQARLGRGFDPGELRRIKRLWVRHSIAEDARDIDGLVATLTPDCTYEIVPTGQHWEGHAGARGFYRELFAAFPDNAFALSEIVIGPQGAFEVATLTGTNQGPWAGVAPSGLAVSLEVLTSSRGTPSRSGSPGSGSGSTAARSDRRTARRSRPSRRSSGRRRLHAAPGGRMIGRAGDPDRPPGGNRPT
jgi:hypothetical protein